MDLTDVLVAIGEIAQERERGIAILIDEVQFLSPKQLEALIQAVHKTVQRKLPITFVGAGPAPDRGARGRCEVVRRAAVPVP